MSYFLFIKVNTYSGSWLDWIIIDSVEFINILDFTLSIASYAILVSLILDSEADTFSDVLSTDFSECCNLFWTEPRSTLLVDTSFMAFDKELKAFCASSWVFTFNLSIPNESQAMLSIGLKEIIKPGFSPTCISSLSPVVP